MFLRGEAVSHCKSNVVSFFIALKSLNGCNVLKLLKPFEMNASLLGSIVPGSLLTVHYFIILYLSIWVSACGSVGVSGIVTLTYLYIPRMQTAYCLAFVPYFLYILYLVYHCSFLCVLSVYILYSCSSRFSGISDLPQLLRGN